MGEMGKMSGWEEGVPGFEGELGQSWGMYGMCVKVV